MKPYNPHFRWLIVMGGILLDLYMYKSTANPSRQCLCLSSFATASTG